MDGTGIDADLVSTSPEDLLDIFKRSDTPANRKRQEKLVSRPLDKFDNNTALLLGRGDIQKDHFIGTLFVIPLGKLDRVARITQLDKVRSFHNPAVL
jgi:hypothetical protein